MNYGEGFYQRPRKSLLFLGSLAIGLVGVMLGALLVYGLLVLPKEEPPSPGPENGAALPGPSVRDSVAIEVIEQVMPAVVGVNKHVYVSRYGQRVLRLTSQGSGVVISPDGYIVTNHHVVEGAVQINVVFPDTGTYEAALVGVDPYTDLALLKLESEQTLTYIPLGDSSTMRVGEAVLAIGNPLGFQQTVTAGIISGLERQVRIPHTNYYFTFLQTDAGINPGNSGGPLINLWGEVIGINSIKVAEWGFEAIGFAIPSNTVQRVAGDLRKYGEVRRPMLGIYPQLPEESTVDRGVQINEVLSGSPAEQGGLQEGDVIIAIGTSEINYLAQLYAALLEYYPGDNVTLTIIREGREQNVNITLDEM